MGRVYKGERFQATMEAFMESKGVTFNNNTKSETLPDYEIKTYYTFKGIKQFASPSFWMEVKEKNQEYNMENWPETDISEEDLFICDDLTLRKLLLFCPDTCLVARDNLKPPPENIIVFFIIDLFYFPKFRLNRPAKKDKVVFLKGKCFLDQNWGILSSLDTLFLEIRNHLEIKHSLYGMNKCYWVDRFNFEKIEEGGILRTPEHYAEDLEGNI